MVLRFKCTLFFTAILVLTACQNGPKVIEPTAITESSQDTSAQSNSNIEVSSNTKFHSVVVTEVLPTSKYVYLKVREGQEEFWIATGKMEVKKGETYFYNDGLLKTDFRSEEHNRVFEKIYLVSKLISKGDHTNLTKSESRSNSVADRSVTQKENIPTHTEKEIQHMGAITIAELVKDTEKYEGHSVEVSGTCVKVNSNIMGRNWIHLQDGTQDDFDLVVTSNARITEGSTITIRAVVALNRDFGSGYSYDLILENGTLIE